MIDWVDLKDSLRAGFAFLGVPILTVGFAEHEPELQYGSIISIVGYVVIYVIVRRKAQKQSTKIYDSNGKLINKRQNLRSEK